MTSNTSHSPALSERQGGDGEEHAERKSSKSSEKEEGAERGRQKEEVMN